MFLFGKKPHATAADAARFFALAQARVEARTGPLYPALDGTRVFTRAHVSAAVRRLLEREERNLDRATIAAELGIATTALDDVLPSLVHETGSYADAVHVLPAPRIAAVLAALRAHGDARPVSAVCAAEHVTLRALTAIVKRDASLVVVNDLVFSADALDARLQQFRARLSAADAPVAYASIEPDAALLAVLKHKLGLPVHEGTYTPPAFAARIVEEAAAELAEHGTVDVAAVTGVESAVRFARAHAARVLGERVVADAFIDAQVARALDALAQRGYFDVQELPAFVRPLVAQDDRLRRFRSVHANLLVRPALEKELEARLVAALAPEAARQAQTLAFRPDGSTTVEALAAKVRLPTQAEIQALTDADLPSMLVRAAVPGVRQGYGAAVAAALRQRLERDALQLQAKCRAYLNGLQALPPASPLRASAWDEWLQYVSEHAFAVPGSEQEAERQFDAADADVQQAVADIMQVARQQLERTDNAAKVLYLGALVYSAEHFVTCGALKLSSKQLPKLLGAFPFPREFAALRSELKKPKAETMVAVKALCASGTN